VKPQLSFIAYPVNDISVSRSFYSTVLAVEPHAMSDDWLEYDIGDASFVITQADAGHSTPVRGALVAFEVADIETEIARLRSQAVAFCGDIVETAVCRFIVALDPDKNEFLIHQRKPKADATQTI
jgi:predicted enzyme related to lactoylglutathione lyase